MKDNEVFCCIVMSKTASNSNILLHHRLCNRYHGGIVYVSVKPYGYWITAAFSAMLFV